MPCDYSKYPTDWKTVIRPAILRRAKNKCEICGLENHLIISRDNKRGLIKDLMNGPVWQYAENGKLVKSNYSWRLTDWCSDHMAKVILTIMHLDHDTTNNDYSNLKAACQKCHLNHDLAHHKKNSRETRKRKRGLMELFP